jgi:methylglutamate dehydrogenase subunit D
VSVPESLAARSALAAHSIASQGWSGSGIALADRFDVSAAMITLRQGYAAPEGLKLPRANAVTVEANLTVMACGVRRYLAVVSGEPRDALLDGLQRRIGAMAAIVDYSDQLAFISAAGPNAALVLSRLCSIDLDPRAFAPLGAAVVRMESVRAFLWREERGARFMIGVQRSLVAGAWELLLESCESLAAE